MDPVVDPRAAEGCPTARQIPPMRWEATRARGASKAVPPQRVALVVPSEDQLAPAVMLGKPMPGRMCPADKMFRMRPTAPTGGWAARLEAASERAEGSTW